MRVSSRRRKAFVAASVSLLTLLLAAAGLYFKGTLAAREEPAGSGQAAEGGPDGAPTPSEGGVAPASNDQAASSPEGEEKKEGQNGKTAVPVSVTAVSTGTMSSYISSTGNLVAEDEVKVLAEAEGRVAELTVEEGDRVARGQVLAALVKDDAEIALRKAELRLSNAEMAYERGTKALAENLLSREDYDKVTMEKEIADQELAEARWRLDKTAIKSPFGGRLTERAIRLGQHIRPGDTLFTVADFDPLVTRIYLPEKDVFDLSVGREVRITLKADEEVRFQGRIRQISPVVDTATGTVKVTVEAIQPPAAVRPGAFVTIDVVRETHPRALLVPRQAVIRELQEAYVFVSAGDVATKRPVKLGLEEGDYIEALSGVAAGEQVIVAGQGGLKDGSPIKVIPSPQGAATASVSQQPARG